MSLFTSVNLTFSISDVPQKYWSCCMLGKLTGEKGFHCHATFYTARMNARNFNRAHNNKMLFHGKNRNPHWGKDIMVTFERCIANHADEFHKCCYASAIEREERYKWHFYRNQRQMIGSSEEDESAQPISELDAWFNQRSLQAAKTSLHQMEIHTTWTRSQTVIPTEMIRTQNRTQAGRKRSSTGRRRHHHKRHRGT